jgi:hypothetical protein
VLIQARLAPVAISALLGVAALAAAACRDEERAEPGPGPNPVPAGARGSAKDAGVGPGEPEARRRERGRLIFGSGDGRGRDGPLPRARGREARADDPFRSGDQGDRAGRETYQLEPRGELDLLDTRDRECGFDPHAPIGSLPGTASVQETVALPAVVIRLLRDAIRTATVVEALPGGASIYRVVVDPARASVAPSAHGGDELINVDPRRLARHLARLRVTLDPKRLVRRLTLELRRFRPAVPGPRIRRERRRVDVSVTVWLGDFGRRLEVRAPSCVAME